MKKIFLLVEIEYDDEIMHGDDEESERWFMDFILRGKGSSEKLVLHSNEIGDSICDDVRVLEVFEANKAWWNTRGDANGRQS